MRFMDFKKKKRVPFFLNQIIIVNRISQIIDYYYYRCREFVVLKMINKIKDEEGAKKKINKKWWSKQIL